MAKVLYTAEATVSGGRDGGHGKTGDGQLEVDIRIPEQLGGEGGGTNPEQLFALGFGACFENSVRVVGKRMKQEVGDVSVDSKVHLVTGEERSFKVAVELDVSMPSVDDKDQAAEVVRNAHAVCPYSNATRDNVDVTITVNGDEVGGSSET